MAMWESEVGGSGTDSNAIHDNVAGEIAALTAKATPVNADLLIIEDSADSNNKKKVEIGNLPSSGTGESNTASNQGTDGVGVYDTKAGVDLQFRNVAPASNKVTITLNTKDIDIDVVPANINNISDVNATDLTDGGDSTLHYHASDRDRSNHTGTQTAATISDFDTEVSNNSSVVANSAKVTNATHSGDVTGATTLTIAADAVTYAKIQNVVDDQRILGNIAGAGSIVAELTAAQVRTMINVADGATAGDANAIHDNVASEISALNAKATPVSGDLIIIEDSADSNNKKKVEIGNLPSSGISNVVEDTTPQLGGNLDGQGNQISDVVFLDCADKVNAIGSIGGGTQDIDYALGPYVTGTVDTSETTFTFSNIPASGNGVYIIMKLTNPGSQTLNFPAGYNFVGGEPTWTASGTDIIMIETSDAMTNYNIYTVAQDV